MKRFKRWQVPLIAGALVLLSVGNTSQQFQAQEVSSEVKRVAASNTAFALDLYLQLSTNNGNLFLSPFSVSSVLGVAASGARASTEEQILRTMHWRSNPEQLSAMPQVLDHLNVIQKNGRVKMNVANELWLERTCDFSSNFLSLAKQQYASGIHFANFATGHEAARKEMNAWVEKTTEKRIKGFLGPGSLSPNSKLAILNSIYFKGKWASAFDARNTKQELFWPHGTEAVRTPMMHQSQELSYAETPDLQVLELPYLGDHISMVVLLPKERNGLAALEKKLTLGNLTNWFSHLVIHKVDLQLPKFQVQGRYSLVPLLRSMGMADAFQADRADFTGITPTQPFLLSSIDHAALVEVNEEGTEAAAATGASFGCSAMPAPATFHADHPFIFLIRERCTETILFLGRVVEPKAF